MTTLPGRIATGRDCNSNPDAPSRASGLGLKKFTVLFLIQLVSAAVAAGAPDAARLIAASDDAADNARLLFLPVPEMRQQALKWMRERNDPDVVPSLIHALRYVRDENGEIAALLRLLTGADHGEDWSDWMLWQQAHPEVMPFAGFDEFQSDLFASIDPNFRVFIYPSVRHEIRLEEITWGGVVKDGIPALNSPSFVTPDKATYLTDGEPVFGIVINGDARAYPYRIMDWHEMANDVVGGVPVALAYCTLCGSGILFDTRVAGRSRPFVFGSSGFLYRSNKLMYDQETHSLWNQFTGRPVVGALTASNIELTVMPLVTTTWSDWKKQHPGTKVLAIDTGFNRDYTPGRPYGDYFASPGLMFPALTGDGRLNPKDQVFGLRVTGAEKAWPLQAFAGGRVINDRVGVISLVLIGDAETRSVRAYRSEGRRFEKHGQDLSVIVHGGRVWQVRETELLGPDKESLARLPGHLAYWFAWSGYLGKAELYNR